MLPDRVSSHVAFESGTLPTVLCGSVSDNILTHIIFYPVVII